MANSDTATTGTGTVWISLDADSDVPASVAMVLDRPDGTCVLRVRDTGCGMNDDVLAHMFDPFFTSAPPPLAPGLGLSAV